MSGEYLFSTPEHFSMRQQLNIKAVNVGEQLLQRHRHLSVGTAGRWPTVTSSSLQQQPIRNQPHTVLDQLRFLWETALLRSLS